MEKTQSDITVVILTLNEENNIANCIQSVLGLTHEVLVIDSLSSDSTVRIAKTLGARVVSNPFLSFDQQRNFALKDAGIRTEWTFFLDADERLSLELIEEIKKLLSLSPSQNGFKMRWRLFWNGRWIKRGYYGSTLLRLVRTQRSWCEERSVNEHLQVEGEMAMLKADLIHQNENGIERWHLKHLKYAELEALEYLKAKSKNCPKGSLTLKRWVHLKIWNRMPLFLRPWCYFFYRFFFCLGFLDGWQGLSFHFFQGLWFQYLISYKIKELEQKQKTINDFPETSPQERFERKQNQNMRLQK